jgi:hypothetical protein
LVTVKMEIASVAAVHSSGALSDESLWSG